MGKHKRRHIKYELTECNCTENPHTGYKLTIRDIVHIVLLGILFVYTLYAVFIDAGFYKGHFWHDILVALLNTGISEIFTFIGAIAFILFGIVGIYEFSYLNGLYIIIPPYYINLRKSKDEKTAEMMMKVYYEKDIDFIRQYEQERVGFILQALKINDAQFQHLRYELVKARALQAQNLEELQSKASQIVYNKLFIEDLTNEDPCNRVYEKVDYFINLYTALYDTKLCSDVSRIMANYIIMCLKEGTKDIDYIVVPSGSNLLMGLEVGRIIGKPVISIQEKARVHKNECWDGKYECKAGHTNSVIIIHDVLVTSDRICDVTKKLTPNTYKIEGLFCLIKYEHDDFCPEEKLKTCNINGNQVHCLLNTNKEKLKQVLDKDVLS